MTRFAKKTYIAKYECCDRPSFSFSRRFLHFPISLMKALGAGPGRLLSVPRIAAVLILYTTFIYFALSSLTESSHQTITPEHKRALDLLASDQGQYIIDNLQRLSEKITEEATTVPPPPTETQTTSPQQCDYTSIERNTDPNHTRAHLQFWQNLAQNAIRTYQNDWQTFVADLSPYSNFSDQYEGTGIVFTAGNKDTLSRAMTILRLIRDYGCDLPVEVWHLSDETPGNREIEELVALNAINKDLSDPSLVRPVQKKRDAEKQ